MDFPGKNFGVGCHALLQGISPTQGSNPCLLCLLHWQVGSLPWCPLGSPRKYSQSFMQSEALDPTSSGPASWFHHLSISNPSCLPPSPDSSWQSILEVLKLLLPKCFYLSMITYVTQDPKCFSRHSNTLVAFLSLPEGLGSWAQIGWSSAPTMDGPNPGYQGQNWGLASQTLHQLASTHLTLLALHTSNLLSPFPCP